MTQMKEAALDKCDVMMRQKKADSLGLKKVEEFGLLLATEAEAASPAMEFKQVPRSSVVTHRASVATPILLLEKLLQHTARVW